MENQIRVRFAPSPTGYLHVGGLRTALYNYLFAKHHGGKFILRIEDTDQSRKVEGAVENLIETLKWAGIEYDEGPDRGGSAGPYIQSQRLDLYRAHAQELVNQGHAYHCFCTTARLQEVRQKQLAAKLSTSYDRHCRSLSREEAERRIASGEKSVIRMKIPLDGELSFEDVIRGSVTISYKMIDDQVLIKSDGYPTYHLAVVVDDHLMGITHVIRGEEWLSSVPKHILLYRYFGWEAPVLAHLPLLLNPDKSKLSKRQGDVAVEDYRTKGYLKEAMVNFIAFLGWNPGDEREIFFMDQLSQEFSLDRVGKSGAVFNIEKLNWLNQQHIKLKSNEELARLIKPLMLSGQSADRDDQYFLKVVGLLKERLNFPNDFIEMSGYFFQDPDSFDDAGVKKYWEPETSGRLKLLADRFESLPEYSHSAIESALRQCADELQIKPTKLIHPARLALSGRTIGPGLFEMLELLGKESVVRRLRGAAEKFKGV
ncbi:MAG: glutamate--tRNA ligase [Ignavibacteriae bacterium]|nr:MAG: glutamate--tRNA ligase [Ignavibacteriota bacterium]